MKRLFAVSVGIFLASVTLILFLTTTGADAPGWLRERFETQLSAAYPDGQVRIGVISLAPLKDGLTPKVSIKNIQVRDAQGNLRAVLPEIEAKFSAASALRGQVRPISIVLKGASVHLKRDHNGEFDISVGDPEGDRPDSEHETAHEAAGSVGDIMARIEEMLAIPVLANLDRIESIDTSVSIDDALSKKAWKIGNGVIVFEQTETQLSANVRFDLASRENSDADDFAWASFGWRREKGADISELSTRFNNVRAKDIAEQVVAFDWLKVLDAPISGSLALDMSDDGSFGKMHGVLDVGSGVLRQTDQSQAVEFRAAKAYLSYDQNQKKFTFDEISVNTDAAEITANGHIYLSERADRTTGAVIAQLRFSKIQLNPPGVFASPVKFDLGALDMRVQLDPLVVDIGQMVLVDGDTRIVAKGKITLEKDGPNPSIDLSINSVSSARVIELWPLIYKPQTRLWMDENVLGGDFHNVTGAIRGAPGEPPRLTLGFDLRDLNVRFMKTLPPIENGTGYGVLGQGKLSLVLEKGVLVAPDGGQVNLAGTVFQILNTRIKGSPAEVTLKTQSSITSLLSVLDLKPFQFLSKAGLATDIAQGTLSTDGRIAFPLVKKITFDLVDFSIDGKVRNVSTSRLIKGKILSADALKVAVDNSGITISGEARLGRLPVSGLWRQEFGPQGKGKSKVEGQIEISQRFLDEFGIKLPKGAVQGRGIGHMDIDLVRDKAPGFHLVSDLNRVQLAIAALGWSKPKNVKARLLVEGEFSSPPKITAISLKTRGLETKGSVTLKADGKLDVARFDPINIDDWMKTPIEIRSDANGNAMFSLTGGVLDFRKSRFGGLTSEGPGNRIAVKLDRLILSRGISLTDIEGDLNTKGGMTGSFSGRVNGGARIVGTLAPFNGGTGVRFTSNDAGEVFRSAGLFSGAFGGRMDMILVPAGKRGHYNGTMSATKLRVRNASALAEILSALSVVGLLEQLTEEGIAFSNVDAKFLLTPNGVQLQEGSAVGVSLGLTMAGAYDFAAASMNMQGVITPVYLLNSILEQTKIFGGLFGKKKGEGVLGFNYTLKGKTSALKVGVNPLSILAPGVFREIFRTPIPRVSDQ